MAGSKLTPGLHRQRHLRRHELFVPAPALLGKAGDWQGRNPVRWLSTGSLGRAGGIYPRPQRNSSELAEGRVGRFTDSSQWNHGGLRQSGLQRKLRDRARSGQGWRSSAPTAAQGGETLLDWKRFVVKPGLCFVRNLQFARSFFPEQEFLRQRNVRFREFFRRSPEDFAFESRRQAAARQLRFGCGNFWLEGFAETRAELKRGTTWDSQAAREGRGLIRSVG